MIGNVVEELLETFASDFIIRACKYKHASQLFS